MDVKADESVLNAEGHIDPAKLRPIIFAPGSSLYYGLGEIVGKAFSIGKEIGG